MMYYESYPSDVASSGELYVKEIGFAHGLYRSKGVRESIKGSTLAGQGKTIYANKYTSIVPDTYKLEKISVMKFVMVQDHLGICRI